MARPRKTNSNDLLRIVNSFWESHGDPKKLKCSLLEEYSAGLGFEFKAYDFRRDDAVRNRISELQSGSESGTFALAYKNLDADSLIAGNPTKPALKAVLTDLDTYWRGIYDHAVQISEINVHLLSENAVLRKTVNELNNECGEMGKLSGANAALTLENRYLRSALSRWLYPALANEILLNNGILTQVDTEVTDVAITEMSDSSIPIALSATINSDVQIINREQGLIERMKDQIGINGGSK